MAAVAPLKAAVLLSLPPYLLHYPIVSPLPPLPPTAHATYGKALRYPLRPAYAMPGTGMAYAARQYGVCTELAYAAIHYAVLS
eukprot:3941166-Rhodomonas_salina.1